MTADTVARAAAAAMDRAGIRWAVLRDDPLRTRTADVDLLVHPADADRLDATLAPHGFARLRTWRHGPHRFFVAYDREEDAWVKLDIVTRLAYRSGTTMPDSATSAALRRAQRVGDTVRLARDDEFWALMLHCLLDRGSVADRHRKRLQRLAVDVDLTGPLRDALDMGGGATVDAVDRVRAGDMTGLLSLANRLDAALVTPPRAERWRAGLLAALAPALKAVRRPGLSLALLGPDGAGKSTLIGALTSRFFFPARSFYVGLYGGGRRHHRGRLPGMSLAGQLARLWRAYLIGAYHRRRGRLVVYDRYGYDALLASSDGPRTLKRRARAFLIGRLCPRPDLVVVLDAPAALLHDRTGEHTVPRLEAQRAAYRHLSERLRAHGPTEVVDATLDANAVRRDVTAALWRTYVRRQAG